MSPRFDQVTWDRLCELAQFQAGPCVSIYVATHEGLSGETSLGARLRRLVGATRRQLDAARAPGIDALLRPADEIVAAQAPTGTDGGIAIFLGPGFARQFAIDSPCADAAHMGDAFWLLPLTPRRGDDERFHILALSRKRARLLAADRQAARELDLPRLALGMEALLQFDTEAPARQIVTAGSRGDLRSATVFHGRGDASQHDENDLREYLRQIDHEVCRVLAASDQPLVVASVEKEFAAFCELTQYRHVLPRSVRGNPDLLSANDLHAGAWPLVSAWRQEQFASELRRGPGFENLAAVRNNLPDMFDAARAGRIAKLFLARGASLWGRVDPASQAVSCAEPNAENALDLLEPLARLVWSHRGRVEWVEPGILAAGVPLATVARG